MTEAAGSKTVRNPQGPYNFCERCDKVANVVIDGYCAACAEATAWSRPLIDSCDGCQRLVHEVALLGTQLAELREKVLGIQEVNDLWDGSHPDVHGRPRAHLARPAMTDPITTREAGYPTAPNPQGDDFEWDEEVQVLVTLRVRAKPNPDYYEGLQGRTPLDAAMTGAWRGGCTLDRVDGFADMTGEVDVIDVAEGY